MTYHCEVVYLYFISNMNLKLILIPSPSIAYINARITELTDVAA